MPAPVERQLELTGGGDPAGPVLRGWVRGEGTPLLLAHGITAHRDLVLHGSSHLPRHGFEVASYDARAHGESEGAPEGSADGYTYETLAADLRAVSEAAFGSGARPILTGHSMGAHTVLNAALADPTAFRGLVVIGPVSRGQLPSEASLAGWDALADGLESGGLEGWMEAYEAQGLDPAWRDTLLRIARERMSKHRHLDALAVALREVPRSLPFSGLEELVRLELPVLVVASHDIADPGHPYETAREISEAIPGAELISEEQGESPLAWQGGKLSREIGEWALRMLSDDE
jgi:pimeloyl-ACP methyl ester carboxylesterase